MQKTVKQANKVVKQLNTKAPQFQKSSEGKTVVMCVNRGEIATRVYRAAKEQGFDSLGVYSDVDKKSLHRFKSDKSIQLDSSKSAVAQYLDIDNLVKIGLENGADIIHPGYGFLGENPELASKVEAAGMLYAGPTADVIQFFGDKIESKIFAKKHNVPVPEGTTKPVTLEEAKEFSKEISYPVMVKATCGGGGRGIRIARDEAELIESYERCSSEALAAFGNGDIFIEKFIEEPRHIEVQILADGYGNVVHLFERDCSVQRRNQKVVEIAPCATIDEASRQAMCNDAIKLCKEAKYRSAGTVEFLVDKNNKHYFIECNTRIQVEHTVTEEVTQIDIVGAQLRIAKGASLEELGITQDKIATKGYAIQLRLTTEDAADNFSPCTGRLQYYQPGGGKGIRIDGNAYSGFEVTPSYDSLLCKITGRARTFEECARKLVREIQETKISGIKTNKNFLQNVLEHPKFLSGNFTTAFIAETPELFDFPPQIDGSTKILNWFGNFIVNKSPKIEGAQFLTDKTSPQPPKIPEDKKIPLTGYKDILNKQGPEGLAKAVLNEKKVLLTDTTMRDAHQSLLMTRMRTRDILQASETTAQTHKDFFSLENWGGATFDVSMRFLHECPWERLERMREIIPNIPFQMLLRGASAVGYTNYADNIVQKFCDQAVKSGMDVFRVFDSLNYYENMKLGMDSVGAAGGVIEAAICYTGIRDKYTLEYYVEYARQLVNHGCHFLAIKDMTGLLKPDTATLLVSTLKKEFPNTPLHVHMHDNAGSAIASLYACVNAGADIIDLATDSMSGVTSQGSFGTMINLLKGHERDPKLDIINQDFGLNQYWRDVRDVYAPFESPERSSFSDTFQHEMPGGQYTNLQFQAKSLGLGNEWERVKTCYMEANQILGDIVKVTPSSKIVGDLANFMVTNNLRYQQVIDGASTLDFPKSVLEYLQGQIGQPYGGFPEPFRSQVLKSAGLEPLNGRPGETIPAFDFDARKKELIKKYGETLPISDADVISSALYKDVFNDYCEIRNKFGFLTDIPTEYLLRPVEQGEEVCLTLRDGTPMDFEYIGQGATNHEDGLREVVFRVNGALRSVQIEDLSMEKEVVQQEIADQYNPLHIAAPIQSTIVEIKVQPGDKIEQNQVVAVVSAMKMEMTIKAPQDGVVKRVLHGANKQVVTQALLIELA